MKHYFIAISILALLSLNSSVYSQTASDYFLPVNVGNYLNLHTVDIPQYSGWGARTTRHYFDRTDFIYGYNYLRSMSVEIMDNNQLDTMPYQVVWVRKDSVGNILAGAMIVSGNSSDLDSALKIYPAFPWFPNEYLIPGYSRYMGSILMKDSVISVTQSVTTPAGSFSNCIEVCSMNLDSSGNITLRDYAWYAKGIGIVQEMRDIPVNQTYMSLLVTYRSVVSVKNENPLINVSSFTLEQNYPNPFNPSTVINYSIPKSGDVKLSVYDITGSKVATIVNENKPAGSYSVQFNGAGLASGIYMYHLESGNYTASRKFILMK